MAEGKKLKDPWLVAVWPGIGNVAIGAGYYLMAKLGMHQFAEFAPHELFDAEHIDVRQGLIKSGALPRSRLFAWRDPRSIRDVLVFIGEAQPPSGKYGFCRRLVDYVQEQGVRQVFTFAAMATQMHPSDKPRVFAAATDPETLSDLVRLETPILHDGRISGLNGVFLGVAADLGLRGACLLGETPHVLAQFPFPRASLEVLEVFAAMTHLAIDLEDLRRQASEMDERLGQWLSNLSAALAEEQHAGEIYVADAAEAPLTGLDRQRIEELFRKAEQDRSEAYELKAELDRQGVFAEYEDRFLDLFKEPG